MCSVNLKSVSIRAFADWLVWIFCEDWFLEHKYAQNLNNTSKISEPTRLIPRKYTENQELYTVKNEMTFLKNTHGYCFDTNFGKTFVWIALSFQTVVGVSILSTIFFHQMFLSTCGTTSWSLEWFYFSQF